MSQNSKQVFKDAITGIRNHSREAKDKTKNHIDTILTYVDVLEQEYNDVQDSLRRANAMIEQHQIRESTTPISPERRKFLSKF